MNILAQAFLRKGRGHAAVRRSIAAHLVQATTGMSLAEAGAYLAIPPGWMTDWKRFRPLEERIHGRRADLSELLERLTDHVARHPSTNYHARRQRFAHWTLSTSEMQKIDSGYTGRRRRIAAGTLSGPRIHACLSAMAWSQLTGSEWRLAPSMQPPMTPRDGPSAIDATLICMLGRPQPRTHYYCYLRAVLADRTSAILAHSGCGP